MSYDYQRNSNVSHPAFFEINWPVLLAYYELPGTAQGPAETARSSFGSLATRYVISVVTHFAKS